jgi:ABC-type multidrug transport system fused ATPase/permease subunit
LSDPDILILDDATSSVDMETEQAIQEAMDTVKTGRTTLIIAYRISSVKDADQILVLKNGTIYERGTHEELVAKRGKYYQTLLEQYSEYHEYDRTEGRGA